MHDEAAPHVARMRFARLPTDRDLPHLLESSSLARTIRRHREHAYEHSALARRARPEDDESLGGLSARNRLFGHIEEVRVDGLLAQVQLRVGDQRLTAVITADAVRRMKLRRGDDAIGIVKSTEVMIALPPTPVRAMKRK